MTPGRVHGWDAARKSGDTEFFDAELLNGLEPVTEVVEWDAAAAF